MAIDYTLPAVQTTQDAQVPSSVIQTPTTPANVYSTPTAQDFGAQYDAVAPTITPESQAVANENAQLKSLLGIQTQAGQEQAQQFASLGGNDATAKLANITAQYKAADLQNQAQQQAYLGQTRSIGGYTQNAQTGGMEDINRANAVKKLGLAADAAILQGNIEQAKTLSEQAIKAKYGDVQAQIDQHRALYDLNKDMLSRADKAAAEKKNYILDQQQKYIDKQMANDNAISNLVINAATQGAPQVLRDKAKLAKTPMEAANILGKYAGDYGKSLLLDEQIKTEKAQQANYYANVNKTKAETTALNNPNGIPSKPLTETQAKDLTYAQRASQATPVVSNLESKITAMNPVEFATQWKLVQNPLTSGQVSPEIRQYYQAAKNFTSATLRRESGASIASGEYNDAFSTYLPFPGDDTTTLAQKKQARDTAVSSFKQNVPGYNARVATVEDSYLDKQALPAVVKVNDKVNNPVSSYRMMLQGLPGTKN
jgi:hypothetical protein